MTRAACVLAGLLFLFCAALQFNDPDPLYWMTVYAATALVTLARGFGHRNRFRTAVVLGAVAAGLLIAAPGFLDYLAAGDPGMLFADMAAAPSIEAAREFIGLALALLVLAAIARA